MKRLTIFLDGTWNTLGNNIRVRDILDDELGVVRGGANVPEPADVVDAAARSAFSH